VQVKHIGLNNFMNHTDSTLPLAAIGLYVLSGGNGAGKSSFCEAVAYCCGGETLRGTSPWQTGRRGAVVVDTDVGTVERSVDVAGKKSAKWYPSAASTYQGDTNTKTDEAIRRAFGDIDIWRRTHVFSSADAAHFTAATDSGRKRLIEQMLGLDRFDLALEATRAELKDARSVLLQAKQSYKYADATVQELRRRLGIEIAPARMELEAPTVFEFPAWEVELLAELEAVHLETVQRVNKLRQVPRSVVCPELTQRVIALRSAIEKVETELARANAGECTTCGAPFQGDVAALADERAHTAELLQAAYAEVLQSDAAASAANNEHASALNLALQEAQNFDYQIRTQQQKLAGLRAKAEASEQAMAHHLRNVATADAKHKEAMSAYNARIAQLEHAIDQKTDELDALWLSCTQAQTIVDELEVCEKVLGLKGVRASVLSHALASAEALANLWLAQMDSQLSVKLNPFTVLKSGDLNQDISIEVLGAGGGFGYKASSGGERRRIDAALLLAFAEVAEAASGKIGGTLFIDEVFDAIDPDGCAGVSAVLAEIAKTRCVVVITHRAELAWMLKCSGATEYRAVDGTLSLIP
jgi:DNA repair exonuclease SbcCD ATPase subunit